MPTTHRDAYLENHILSASPQKLRLMLIEGAQRLLAGALEHWNETDFGFAFESLVRARSILVELLQSVRAEGIEDPQIDEAAKRTVALYLFLFKSVTAAIHERDRAKVDEVARLLEIERETWQAVCEQLPQAPAAIDGDGGEATAEQNDYSTGTQPEKAAGSGGFSLDA